MKFIIGSGLIGCLARQILGQEWAFIPFKKSRYYSFEIPLADNFLRFDNDVDTFYSSVLSDQTKIIYKRPFSYLGQLINQENPAAIDAYLRKVYVGDIPILAKSLQKTTFTVYNTNALALYMMIQKRYWDNIQSGSSRFETVFSIDLNNRVIVCPGGSVNYDKLVCTIPLNVLAKLCGVKLNLKSRNVCYYYILTDKINLEGAEQSLVSDLDIEFFKVNRVGENEYVIWTFEALENPYMYFGKFLGYQLDIQEVFRIEDAIPVGDPPDLSVFENGGITCVGSNAQHDDFMDVSSSIKRLLRIKS